MNEETEKKLARELVKKIYKSMGRVCYDPENPKEVVGPELAQRIKGEG